MKAFLIMLLIGICLQKADGQVIRVPVGEDSLIWIMPDTSSELWCKGGPTICYYQSSIAMDTVAPFYIEHEYTKSSFSDTNSQFWLHPYGIRVLPYTEFLYVDTIRVLYSLIDSGKKYCGTFNCPIGMYVYKPLQVQGWFDDKVRMSPYYYSKYFKLRTHLNTLYFQYDTVVKAYKTVVKPFIIYNNKSFEVDFESLSLSGDSSNYFSTVLSRDGVPLSIHSVPGLSYDSSLALESHCILPPQDSDREVNVIVNCVLRFNGLDSAFKMPLKMYVSAAPPQATIGARLYSNRIGLFPNPGNGSLLMNLFIEVQGNVAISIFDELGREVRRVHDGFLEAGEHEFSAELPTGMYYVRMQAGDEVLTRKVTVVR